MGDERNQANETCHIMCPGIQILGTRPSPLLCKKERQTSRLVGAQAWTLAYKLFGDRGFLGSGPVLDRGVNIFLNPFMCKKLLTNLINVMG